MPKRKITGTGTSTGRKGGPGWSDAAREAAAKARGAKWGGGASNLPRQAIARGDKPSGTAARRQKWGGTAGGKVLRVARPGAKASEKSINRAESALSKKITHHLLTKKPKINRNSKTQADLDAGRIARGRVKPETKEEAQARIQTGKILVRPPARKKKK